MRSTTTETVEALKRSNPCFPKWMRDACEGATTVNVERERTPFGIYVVAVWKAA